MNYMTPQEIVHELDKYIIGQNSAKKAVSLKKSLEKTTG